MVKFSSPLYVTSPSSDRRVMVGGKSPEMVKNDLASGVSRIGGFWRHPNYCEAYLYSANLLIEQGRTTGTLDEIGLPAFYLQRHAIELMLKGFLDWLTSISDLRNELGQSNYQPAPEVLKALGSSHNLKHLHLHVVVISNDLQLPPPPMELESLIRDMGLIEITETWSRYSSSPQKKQKGSSTSTRSHISHIDQEIEIPIVDFQHRLCAVADSALSRQCGGDTYEDTLHDTWSALDAASKSLLQQ